MQKLYLISENVPVDVQTKIEKLFNDLKENDIYSFLYCGFVENIHSLTHLHNGKFSAYRFTVENIVFPLEFLSFILLTNYNYKFDTINSKLKTDHRLTLKNEEKGYFSLRILKDS